MFFKNKNEDATLCGILSNPSTIKEIPVIILVHGLFSSKESRTYLCFETELNKMGFSTFRIDAYGHGESGGTPQDFTITKMKEDILQAIAYLRQQGYSTIGLIGSSSGGIASILAAAESQDLYVLGLIAPVSVNNGKLILKKMHLTARQWNTKGFITYPLRNGRIVRLNSTFLQDDKNYDGFAAARKITIPTIIVHGDKDISVPLSDSRKLAKVIKKATLTIIKGSDHYFSNPRYFKLRQNIIVTFIKKHSSLQEEMMTNLHSGQKAINFTLPDQNGKKVSLSDFKGKWVILYFYPKDNTPGCTIEAIDFTSHAKEFAKHSAVVLGVSPDSGKSHCNFIVKQKLGITLLSDEDKTVLQKYKVWGKKKFMGREYMGVFRTTFLIDPAGKVTRVWKDVSVKGHAQEVLKVLIELAI